MTHPLPGSIIPLLILCAAGLCQAPSGQELKAAGQRPDAQLSAYRLNASQVVENLVRMNLMRAEALLGYQSTRVYRLAYRGFPGGRNAEIVVTVKYLAPETKEFEIVSATGSKLLIDRVFKKMMQAEKEAFERENQKHIAINHENYEFTLTGYEDAPGGPSYVLSVKPRTRNKYLFKGRIWVDADQFAVVRIEAEPARNPSFWIKDTKIETLYMNVGDFWLPARNHSITAVRLGGHADFSIEYKDYRILGAGPLNKLSSTAETWPVSGPLPPLEVTGAAFISPLCPAPAGKISAKPKDAAAMRLRVESTAPATSTSTCW